MADDLNTGLPAEYQAELDAAQRKALLAQLLVKQSMGFKGAESSGPVASRTSPLAWLANAATGYLGNSALADSNKASSDVKIRYQKDQQGAMSQLLGLPIADQLRQGMASPYPQVQSYAKNLQTSREKRIEAGVRAAGEGGDTKGALRIADTGDLSGYTPPERPEPFIGSTPGPNGQALPTVTNFDKFGNPTLHITPGGQTINIDNAGENAAVKALGAKVPDVAENSRKEAIDALDKINNYNQIYKLASDPATITGFAAGPTLGLSAIGAKLGFTGPDAASKTQALMTMMAKQTLAASSMLKGAISDKEKPFLEQASSGGMGYTPEAIRHLAQLSAAIEHNKLFSAFDQYKGAIGQPGAEGAAAMYPFPSITHELPGATSEEAAQYTEAPYGRVKFEGRLSSGMAGGKPAVKEAPTATPPPANGKAYTLEEFQRYFGGGK